MTQADNLNVWVMGPELGEFIAGIRNEDNQQCVTDETRWLYASRASVWKSDDRSLRVKCYEPEGELGEINGYFCTVLQSQNRFRRYRHSCFRSEEKDHGAPENESKTDDHDEETKQDDDNNATEKQ